MIDLGDLGAGSATGTGINAAGQVVGYASPRNGNQRAFLYDGGRMVDLNALIDPACGWTLTEAAGINDLGQIVGTGIDPSGRREAFLLTPIPEPSGLTLGWLALIVGWVAGKRRGCAGA